MEIVSMDSFLPYFDSVHQRTLRVVRAIPPHRIEWRHSEDVFSCGDLARHIAAVERFTFAENVLGRPSCYQGCGPEIIGESRDVLDFMDRMHRETIEILKPLQPEDLHRKGLSPQGTPVTAWKLLRAMVEHEIHHRGEMYVYLALLGVPRPPLFGVTEPELRRYRLNPSAG